MTEDGRMKRLFIFINPSSGRKKQNDRLQHRIENWAEKNNWALDIHWTKEDENLRQILDQNAVKMIDVVGAAGGDGTVSDVIDAMAGYDLPLLIIPVGSGNLFAKNFYIPFEIEKCLNLLIDGSKVGFVDLMKVNGHYRMLNVGAGFNARLMNHTTRAEKRKLGLFAYLKNVGKSIRRTKQVEFILTIDGKQERIRGADVFVANAGFGMHSWIEENLLNPNDGIISLIVTRPSGLGSLFSIFLNALKGKERGIEVIKMYQFENELTIDSDTALLAQSDGELIGRTPLTVTIAPSALKLIVPDRDRPLLGFQMIKDYYQDIFKLTPSDSSNANLSGSEG